MTKFSDPTIRDRWWKTLDSEDPVIVTVSLVPILTFFLDIYLGSHTSLPFCVNCSKVERQRYCRGVVFLGSMCFDGELVDYRWISNLIQRSEQVGHYDN